MYISNWCCYLFDYVNNNQFRMPERKVLRNSIKTNMATEESKQIFCWGRSCGMKRCAREIYVSSVGDPVPAGDKALTRETPMQRGRVNKYALVVVEQNSVMVNINSARLI